ncbi:unnamed protein product, partial [marine sediment metagenome]
ASPPQAFPSFPVSGFAYPKPSHAAFTPTIPEDGGWGKGEQGWGFGVSEQIPMALR